MKQEMKEEDRCCNKSGLNNTRMAKCYACRGFEKDCKSYIPIKDYYKVFKREENEK